MDKKEYWVSYLSFCLVLSFIVFELFYNFVSCRKLIVMQFALVHRDANDFCLVEL